MNGRMNEHLSGNGDVGAGTQLRVPPTALVTASPVRGEAGDPRRLLPGAAVGMRSGALSHAGGNGGRRFLSVPPGICLQQTKKTYYGAPLGKVACLGSRETSEGVISAVVWGTDGGPLGGLATSVQSWRRGRRAGPPPGPAPLPGLPAGPSRCVVGWELPEQRARSDAGRLQ